MYNLVPNITRYHPKKQIVRFHSSDIVNPLGKNNQVSLTIGQILGTTAENIMRSRECRTSHTEKIIAIYARGTPAQPAIGRTLSPE